MFLRSIKAQHYKSLGDVDVEFSRGVTVIVGPNGAGKSNFVDVLRFLRDAVADDLEHAITKREGMARIVQGDKTEPDKIGIECEFRGAGKEELIQFATYALQLKSVGEGGYAIESEKADVFTTKSGLGTPAALMRRDGEGHTYTEATEETENPEDLVTDIFSKKTLALLSPEMLARLTKELSTQFPKDTLAFRKHFPGLHISCKLVKSIAEHISNWNYCTIYPNTLKSPTTPRRDTVLSESGENWASVIKALKRSPKGREALGRIDEAMRAVIPSYEGVAVQTVGSYLVPQFKFRGEGKKDFITFDPVQLSDGTLRLFGILLAAYQLPRPSLLVIEEPEQTIYPGALAVLADVFKEVGHTTQVLITTHSPHLVQHFAPEQIRVATMHDGVTSIRPIHPHQMEAVNEGLLSLEEFMIGEGLRPDDTAPLPK